MSDPASFSGTITGGIQDISALLPLLGTEQCEKHVGSALDRGFLYSSVTPVSIFGSLGIVRAAFNILIASLNIQRYGFLGATKLSDGGFAPSGVVAPMITLDPRHPKRFLAETRLEAMLTEEHIENVEDLTVSWARGILWWNLLLVAFTFVISSIGLAPYVRLILDSHNISLKALFPLGFGFPILRVVGSGLCVNVAQFLIQLRLLVLLKTRLLFITIDRQAKEAGIDLELEINGKSLMGSKKAKSAWNSELASEKCIWALRRFLDNSDTEEWEHYHKIKETYTSQHKRQMDSIDALVPHWTSPLLVFGLVIGCISTVVGYIGCFYLIQRSASADGPLVWLVLEALLSVIRIFVWALNPAWDDSEGIVFELQLASHAPLITCNKFEDDIAHDGIAPLTRSNRFLEDVVAYTGPFPVFVVDDVALYYILTARGGSNSSNSQGRPSGILYVVLYAHKERTSRILFKEHHHGPFSIYLSSLEPVQGSTAINVRVNYSKMGKTDPKTHFLTSDAAFMTQLKAHYDKISLKMQKQISNRERKAFFGKTWAMQRLTEDDDGDKNIVADYMGPTTQDHQVKGSLTAEDIAYLRHGQVARRWQNMYKQLEEWVRLFITLHTQELLPDIPTDPIFEANDSITIVQECEAGEAEFMLIECQRILELLLISTSHEWDRFLKKDHDNMVKNVLQGIFQSPAGIHQDVDTPAKKHSEEIRKNKMVTRLTDELGHLLETEFWVRRDNMRKRLTALVDSTDQRIQGYRYTDAGRKAIMDSWKALLADIPSEATVARTALEVPEFVVKSPFRMRSVVSSSMTEGEYASIQDDAEPLSWSSSTRQNSQQVDEPEGSVDDACKPLLADISFGTGGTGGYAHEVNESSVESSLHLGSVVSVRTTAGRFASIQRDADVLSWSGSTWDSEQIDEREDAVENSLQVFQFIENRHDRFMAKMETRYQIVIKNITEKYQNVKRDEKLIEAKQMNDRSQQRADQVFSKLKDQAAEFQDLHINEVLTADTHELVHYWSKESLQERRRLLNQTQKYLRVTRASIEAVGGRQNMIRALTRSQDFSYIDIHESNLLTSKDLVSVVERIKSLTGVNSLGDGQEIYKAVMANVRTAEEAHRNMCFCSHLMVTDQYRTGKPYLLFVVPGASFCDVHFHIQTKCDHTITLRHCVTTSEGKVNIKLNGHELRGSWGQTQAVQFNFTNEDIHLPSDHLMDVGQPNVLKIILDNESFGVYWLSDVFLPVRPVQVPVTLNISTA